jgi:hypothetical protein
VWGGQATVCTIEALTIPLPNNNAYLPATYYLMISALIRVIINRRVLNYSYFVYISMYPAASPPAQNGHI